MVVAVKCTDPATQVFTCQCPFAWRILATADIQYITATSVVTGVWLALIKNTQYNTSQCKQTSSVLLL